MSSRFSRWALAFTNSLGRDAEEGFEILKVLSVWIKRLPGSVSGSSAASRLEGLILEGAVKAGLGKGPAVEKVSRFTALLVKKDLIRMVDRILEEVEKILDKRRGTLRVFAESALPLEGDLEKRICDDIRKKGINEVRLEKKINPDLVGGYRLRIGDEIIDASVRFQLQKMAAELAVGGN
jgi:F-type H+-transporting ATPase subunit delta